MIHLRSTRPRRTWSRVKRRGNTVAGTNVVAPTGRIYECVSLRGCGPISAGKVSDWTGVKYLVDFHARRESRTELIFNAVSDQTLPTSRNRIISDPGRAQ